MQNESVVEKSHGSSGRCRWGLTEKGHEETVYNHVAVVQLPSHVQFFTTPRMAACQTSLPLTVSQSLPKFMHIVSVMPSNHLILCRPLFLLPSIFPSIRAFSNEYSGLISFKIDWFDLLAVQGPL